MNGVHDMGGMHGMGPLEIERNEPVFHAEWEAKVFALRRAMSAWGKWNIDVSRHEIELLGAAEYMRQSYYERQLAAFLEMLVKNKFVTREEIERGESASGPERATPALTPEKAARLIARGVPTTREGREPARFTAGDQVRARNLNPAGHTRLPRYVRGRIGSVERDHGAHVFPDTNAHYRGENPQHLYSVRFAARELWGEGAPERDAVYLDLWEDYLEPA